MSTHEIITEALRLPRQSRALLAERLLESLECSDEFAVRPEWREEIRRRCDELDRGTVIPIPEEQVFAEAHKELSF